jgi:hypothetical protein
MSIHSGSMKLFVPAGNMSTADSIHFLVRPHLARMGVQSWGMTRLVGPALYAFTIHVEGVSWESIVHTLDVAQRSLRTTYGLEVISS